MFFIYTIPEKNATPAFESIVYKTIAMIIYTGRYLIASYVFSFLREDVISEENNVINAIIAYEKFFKYVLYTSGISPPENIEICVSARSPNKSLINVSNVNASANNSGATAIEIAWIIIAKPPAEPLISSFNI